MNTIKNVIVRNIKTRTPASGSVEERITQAQRQVSNRWRVIGFINRTNEAVLVPHYKRDSDGTFAS